MIEEERHQAAHRLCKPLASSFGQLLGGNLSYKLKTIKPNQPYDSYVSFHLDTDRALSSNLDIVIESCISYHQIISDQIRSNSTLFSALHSQGAKRTWLEGYRKLKKVQQHQVKAKRSVLAWPDVGQW